MPTLQLSDGSIHYDVAGSGVPLIFLHGVGSSARTWTGQVKDFGRTHLAVAPDLRGYGRSVAAAETVSTRRFAADIAALIEDLNAGPAHVCGLSMGGIVALNLWRDRPELVRSLALADTWATHPSAVATQPQRLAEIDAATMPELSRARMPAVYGPDAPPAMVELGVRVFASLDKAVYRAASADLWTQDLRDVAGSVTVPTLVLVGEHDTITPPPLAEELARLIPGARLVVVAGAGHLTNEENPDAFNAALAGLL
ncbi:MAG: alpha/beta fold hydrolase [Candidatus Dormibacteraeota bacterium]|uniref:Alpha/beta fold hydrolase n=1 Tax=Candidatus Dormiibacter inghamiae TaxID=3127013 RepID=A0A934K9N5_9BACT|nr:alpha/beta fold hydrolase [Candidatus Dormibacteraeota bacterium]